MISKERFIEILDTLKTANDFVEETNDKIRDLRDKLNNDFLDAYSLGIYHDNLVVELLDNMFDTDMVSYWVYELNFGREYKEGYIQEADGTNIDISTVELLYDYISQG